MSVESWAHAEAERRVLRSVSGKLADWACEVYEIALLSVLSRLQDEDTRSRVADAIAQFWAATDTPEEAARAALSAAVAAITEGGDR